MYRGTQEQFEADAAHDYKIINPWARRFTVARIMLTGISTFMFPIILSVWTGEWAWFVTFSVAYKAIIIAAVYMIVAYGLDYLESQLKPWERNIQLGRLQMLVRYELFLAEYNSLPGPVHELFVEMDMTCISL